VHLFQIFFDIPRALIEPDHWHQFWSKLVTQRTRNRGWKKEFDIIAFFSSLVSEFEKAPK